LASKLRVYSANGCVSNVNILNTIYPNILSSFF